MCNVVDLAPSSQVHRILLKSRGKKLNGTQRELGAVAMESDKIIPLETLEYVRITRKIIIRVL